MSSDRIQRQMDFIIEQQARFAEQHAKAEERMTRLELEIAELKERNRENTANIAKLADVVMSLAHHEDGQDERLAAHDKEIDDWIERGKETDARLNTLIDIVDRMVGGRGSAN